MSVCWLMIGDGRVDYHRRSLASAETHVPRPDFEVVIDDSAHELGFAGAIAEGWRQVREIRPDWVFWIELDFTFNRDVPLDRMIAVMERHPNLAQICLLRQAWNEEERRAGGIMQLHPEDYVQRVEAGDIWVEHRRHFSTNPCLISGALCAQGWPQEDQSEGKFTHRLLADPAVRFAYWGAKADEPFVTHIGDERSGHGY